MSEAQLIKKNIWNCLPFFENLTLIQYFQGSDTWKLQLQFSVC